MGRPLKPLSAQVPGVISIAKVNRRKYEESLIKSDGADLDTVMPSDLVDAVALAEYKRVLRRLREEANLVGNLNRSDLLAYANSYSRYMSCVKACRKRDFKLIIETDNGPKPNPICRMMDEARRDMAESSRRLGMTIEGQLKSAKAKADKEESDMEAKFGAI